MSEPNFLLDDNKKELISSVQTEPLNSANATIEILFDNESSNENKLNRWMQMVNTAENPNMALLKILLETETNIMKQFENLKQDLESIGLKNYKSPIKNYTKNMKDIMRNLGTFLPIKSQEEFESLNDELKKSGEKMETLRSLFNHIVSKKNKGIDQDINDLLRSVAAVNVYKNYSAKGVGKDGRVKKNFSLTPVFSCMEDALVDKYKRSSDELRIFRRFSRRISNLNWYYNSNIQ